MTNQNALNKIQRTATLAFYRDPQSLEVRSHGRDVGILDADNQLTASSTEWLTERLKNVALAALSDVPGAGDEAKTAAAVAAANIRREDRER